MSELAEIKRLPVIAMQGMVVLPGMVGHIDLKKGEVEGALVDIMERGGQVALATLREGIEKMEGLSAIFPVGVIAQIKQRVSLPGGNVRILLEGMERAVFRDLGPKDKGLYISGVVEKPVTRSNFSAEEAEVRIRMLSELLGEYVVYQRNVSGSLLAYARTATDLYEFICVLTAKIPFQPITRLSFLMQDREDRLFECVYREFDRELEMMKLKTEINEQINKDVNDSTTQQKKEYLLKEQMKAIRKELGDEDPSDTERFKRRLEELNATAETKEAIAKEISRFEKIEHAGSEAAVAYQYLDTLLNFPWLNKSEDSSDIRKAQRILDEDHYGLKDVKERILEFLAVRALNTDGSAPILCLVGPPGTGKTSIARSIARAMNRKYERICLGGVRDEAQIRGHRRTYVGAMPGNLVKALLHAKVANPLILLDEVDKLGADYKGDPSSALLEVLDSEQNVNFRDHYMELPIDLSPVLFIATANDTQTIPRPLLDRMEIIELSSYMENEKFHIAKDHLWPKQRRIAGLDAKQVSITDGAIREVIKGYTKEAGVRGLERKLAKILRRAAKSVLLDDERKVSVSVRNLEEYLGKEKFHKEKENHRSKVGVATGLAWTQVGGETLEIEVGILPGKGEFDLTGQLGDVMRESCMAALSYVKSIADEYKVEAAIFKENDVHIHIPEGAVPKDGPSAGITIATAILSAASEIPVRGDLAMTGEITLRGRVLEIGGLKEKLLAAKNAGVKTVLIPEGNERDVEDFDREIVEGLEIIPVEAMRDVLNNALVK